MVIDQILLKVGSGHNLLTTDDWSKMGLSERVGIINEDRVQFLSGGQPVGTKEALVAIGAAQK